MNDLKASLSRIGRGYRFRAVAAAAIKASSQAPSLRPCDHRCSASWIRVLMLRASSFAETARMLSSSRYFDIFGAAGWTWNRVAEFAQGLQVALNRLSNIALCFL